MDWEVFCMLSRPSVTKTFSWWNKFFLLLYARTLLGTFSGTLFHRSGYNKTPFLEPETVSKMKMPLQLPSRKDKKKKREKKWARNERTGAGIKKEVKRGECGETARDVEIYHWRHCWHKQSKWNWRKGFVRTDTVHLNPYLPHIGRYLKKLLCTEFEGIKMCKWYWQMFSSRRRHFYNYIKWSEIVLNLPDCKFPKGRICACRFLLSILSLIPVWNWVQGWSIGGSLQFSGSFLPVFFQRTPNPLVSTGFCFLNFSSILLEN